MRLQLKKNYNAAKNTVSYNCIHLISGDINVIKQKTSIDLVLFVYCNYHRAVLPVGVH